HIPTHDHHLRDLLLAQGQYMLTSMARPIHLALEDLLAHADGGILLILQLHQALAQRPQLGRQRGPPYSHAYLGFPPDALPIDTSAVLGRVREETCARLPQRGGDARVSERVREQWSARKVLRHRLWHERGHTHHMAKILREKCRLAEGMALPHIWMV